MFFRTESNSTELITKHGKWMCLCMLVINVILIIVFISVMTATDRTAMDTLEEKVLQLQAILDSTNLSNVQRVLTEFLKAYEYRMYFS